MTYEQENKLKARIVELETLYRNSCAHRDDLANEIDRVIDQRDSARSLAANLEAECAACPDPIHKTEVA